jgi:predicted nucleic acid-binding protein
LSGLAFCDTHIAVYSVAAGVDAIKKDIARKLILDLAARSAGMISTQVLNEFMSVLTRKSATPISHEQLVKNVEELARLIVIPTDLTLVRVAIERSNASQINYWDALIVEAAIRGGAETLYTEDMQHGMRFGTLRVINPFLF